MVRLPHRLHRVRRPAWPLAVAPLLAPVVAARADVVQSGPVSTGMGTIQTHNVRHEVAPGAGRYVVVAASVEQSSGRAARVESATFAGQAMTFLGDALHAGEARAELWGLADPPEGEQLASLRLSDPQGFVVGVLSFVGVDAATPVSPVVGASGEGGRPRVEVAAELGGLVIDVIAARAGEPPAPEARAALWSLAGKALGAGGIAPGAPLVGPAWQAAEAQRWALAAVALRPARPDGAAREDAARFDLQDAAVGSDARSAAFDGPGAAADGSGGQTDAGERAAAGRAVSLAVGCEVGRSGDSPYARADFVFTALAFALAARRRKKLNSEGRSA